MASGNRVSLPQGFDLDALRAHEAMRFDDMRRTAESLRKANAPQRAPGRVANVFRRRGQWSSTWWDTAPDAQEE